MTTMKKFRITEVDGDYLDEDEKEIIFYLERDASEEKIAEALEDILYLEVRLVRHHVYKGVRVYECTWRATGSYACTVQIV